MQQEATRGRGGGERRCQAGELAGATQGNEKLDQSSINRLRRVVADLLEQQARQANRLAALESAVYALQQPTCSEGLPSRVRWGVTWPPPGRAANGRTLRTSTTLELELAGFFHAVLCLGQRLENSANGAPSNAVQLQRACLMLPMDAFIPGEHAPEWCRHCKVWFIPTGGPYGVDDICGGMLPSTFWLRDGAFDAHKSAYDSFLVGVQGPHGSAFSVCYETLGMQVPLPTTLQDWSLRVIQHRQQDQAGFRHTERLTWFNDRVGAWIVGRVWPAMVEEIGGAYEYGELFASLRLRRSRELGSVIADKRIGLKKYVEASKRQAGGIALAQSGCGTPQLSVEFEWQPA